MSIERSEDRKDIVRPVVFQDEGESSTFAFSVNISTSGLCIITNKSLSPGQTVILGSGFFWNRPMAAKAVWSADFSYQVRKVGLALSPPRE